MKKFEQNNALSIIQLEERFEMVVADGDSENTTTIEVETN
jgi:hypothetical protein